ncbi:MAG: fibronectin type III domain-containing protein, partial [Planctomycetia bacterium]|nr:fibronectin type III domain-containing protein [Planctomycetia bacterium]
MAFSAPASNGGATITDYKYSLDGGALVAVGATSSPFVITGLTNGQTYAVRLFAVNSAGDGAASSPVDGTPAVPASAQVTVTGISGALSTTYGTASAERTFTVSGSALTG